MYHMLHSYITQLIAKLSVYNYTVGSSDFKPPFLTLLETPKKQFIISVKFSTFLWTIICTVNILTHSFSFQYSILGDENPIKLLCIIQYSFGFDIDVVSICYIDNNTIVLCTVTLFIYIFSG